MTNSRARGVAGTVGVSYYQLEATASGSIPTDYFLKRFPSAAVSSSNPDSIDTSVVAEDVTAGSPTKGPFNMLAAPFAPGNFTGDYEALTSIGNSCLPFYVQTTCADLSCRALTSVIPPANHTPTNKNSTDAFAGLGF